MKLIIGLGNPGKDYVGTRHNVGFEAIEAFAKELDANWKHDTKRKAEIAQSQLGEEKVILAKPDTYMNKSGDAVQALLSYYHIELSDLLIIQDEMDLEPGRIQFKHEGSPAGHNGIEHIQSMLKSDKIQRMRIGIGRPDDPRSSESWVLGPLSPEHAPNALDVIAAIRDWIVYGVQQAENTWNKKK